jgi:hypothetical protein
MDVEGVEEAAATEEAATEEIATEEIAADCETAEAEDDAFAEEADDAAAVAIVAGAVEVAMSLAVTPGGRPTMVK